MSAWLTKFCAEQHSRYEWVLHEDLVFFDEEFGTFKVPKGFHTDLASIHALRVVLPLVYALLVGYGNSASALHDYAYSQGNLSRKMCDLIFYRSLRAEGVARWRAALFWAGVRCFGSKYYIA